MTLMNDKDSCLWDSSIISRGVGNAKAAANDLKCRRELLIQKAAEWGVNNEDGTVLKTDLWNEAIGCDDFIEAILKSNRFCCGLDFSQQVVHTAHLRYRDSSKKLRASFLVADLRFLPFRDGTFDSMYSPSTLDHMPTYESLRALRELHRTLRREGRALITFDNVLCLWLYALIFRLFLSRFSKRMWWPLSLWECQRLFRASGWNVERHDSILLAPTVGGVFRLVRSPLRALVELIVRVSIVMENRSSVLRFFKAENVFVVRKGDS